ncbi:MAG: PhzF family phenazine biosynthesis protein, partial [Pseudomonadota bacterium]
IGLFLYVRAVEANPLPIDARMFPLNPHLSGIAEDPATGSASAILAGHLQRSVHGGPKRLRISQGIDMGRPSLIETEVELEGGVAKAIRVKGQSVQMMAGRLTF